VERAGLAVPRKSGKGFYDRFRGRVMIPIRGESGRIVAFGGRILGPGEPKYLNSRKAPSIIRARSYGFDRAEAIRRRVAILMEGYLDCLQAYQRVSGRRSPAAARASPRATPPPSPLAPSESS
jgi:DNA primase